ncbi:MAG: hypothetical protein KBC46_09925 [Ferrovibrio sp.]|jgi:predicted phosphodiesterase|nr:hypothetical protein [Ferrovibrio sp.]
MRVILALVLVLVIGCLGRPVLAQGSWSFVALGDMPYQDRDIPDMETLFDAINAEKPRFSVHVGDTKASHTACGEAWNKRVQTWFAMFQAPLIYTPGDNEWTDCHRANPPSDPNEELKLLRRMFFQRPDSLGARPMPLERQSNAYPENQAWRTDGIRFGTLHVVGSFNNMRRDRAEYAARNDANLSWLRQLFSSARGDRALVLFMQADLWYTIDNGKGSRDGMDDLMKLLEEETRRFQKPVLLVHGDSHECVIQPAAPGFGPDAAPIPNLLRVEVPGDSIVDALKITVSQDAAQPFSIKPVMGVARNCAPKKK